MIFDEFVFRRVIYHTARFGAIATLVKTGDIKPYINKNEAFKIYGRKHIECWLQKSLVTPIKDGGHSAALRLSRIEIEILLLAIEIQKAIYTLPSSDAVNYK